MVVQHNLTAMNANRQFGITTNAQAKSTEKLSSGYRINRAGDDAAGLTISEKMRSQIRGLNQASTNAEDGISLIQTAEGALNEAHSILQRMNELAVQGANDTNEGIDRDAINEELDALTKELDRISETTQFNKQNLIDGSFKDKKLQVGANENQKIGITIDNMNAQSLGLRAIENTVTTNFEAQAGNKVVSLNYQGISYAWSADGGVSGNVDAFLSKVQAEMSGRYVSGKYAEQFDPTKGKFYKSLLDDSTFSEISAVMKYDVSAAKAAASKAITGGQYAKYAATSATTASALSSYDTKTVGIARVDNYEVANTSITAIQDAINKVSTQRSALGALQNRLEHTVANLDTASENASAAESRIRDVDMAKEMVEYSKNNILAQAGQSMLAQANQSTQGVLSLLG